MINGYSIMSETWECMNLDLDGMDHNAFEKAW